MAAMGATPAWATLALTVPNAEAGWLEKFAAGFLALRTHTRSRWWRRHDPGPAYHQCANSGTLRRMERRAPERREGRRPLAVSGTLGDAAAALRF